MKCFEEAASRNLLVNAVTAAVFACLAATGATMEFVFPHQAGDVVARDQRAASAAEPTFLGIEKDDFEEIHEWLSLTFVALVFMHAILHRKWLWTTSIGLDPKWQRLRGAVLLAFLGILIALMLAPLLASAL